MGLGHWLTQSVLFEIWLALRGSRFMSVSGWEGWIKTS